MRVLALACLMAIGWIGLPRAYAAAQPVDLDWEAPRGCPDRQRVLSEIQKRLGGRTSDEPQLSASGEIEVIASGYRLDLEAEGGRRVLEAASCEELAESAAVILALLIEPRAAAAATPAGRFWGAVRAELVLDLGVLPGPSVGPGLAIGAGIGGSSLELSGTYLPTQDVESNSADRGDLRAFAARLLFCQRLFERPALAACAGGEYARLVGHGADMLEPSLNVDGTLWSLHLALRVRFVLSEPLALVFEAGAGLPLRVVAFTVEPRGSAHETGAVVGRLRTGLELRF